MKSTLFKAGIAVFVGVVLVGAAQTAHASTLSQSQINAIISLLQSFHADPATVNSVAATLQGSGGYYGGTTYNPSCPVLTVSLVLGATDATTGGQVSQLQRFLSSRYGYGSNINGYFGPEMQAAVAQFQRDQNIYPVTGGVGPVTRAAITRLCGQTYPTYPTYPYTGGDTTFRLDRAFSLYEGQSAQEYRGELTVTLTQIDKYSTYNRSSDDSVRITLGVSCAQGVYCTTIWYPQKSFVVEEDETITYMGYEVTVTDIAHDRATFRIEDDGRGDDDYDDEDASISIEEPERGDDVEQGDMLRVEWTVEDRPSNSSIELSLYTESGRSVGVIAVVEGRSGSYSWRVPTPSVYCTMQYPNGLCGMDLHGDYYIRARLVADTGYTHSYEYDTDDSDVFTIER